MKMVTTTIFRLAVALLALAAPVFPQGTQTGVLSGTVTSSDGAPLPGVVVTAQSPALITPRSVVSDTNGAYIFKGLPPGEYTLRFEMSGLSTVEKREAVAVGGALEVDAQMNVAAIEETVVVSAEMPTAMATASGGAQFAADEIDILGNSRTLVGITELSPGLTDNTPNAGQVSIAGSFSYDNVFLMDGVDINDNLYGSPDDLFIEDAIDEVQVLTSGISAEYGRFSGGVINAVTKRGGNTFSGSFRTDFTNPAWRDETPFEEQRGTEHEDVLGKVYQATLGGPVVKDRLWFFTAARRQRTSLAEALPETGLAYTRKDENDRQEIKLTGSINPNHTLQGTFLRNPLLIRDVPTFDFSIDPRTIEDIEYPNTLFVANYSGVLRSNLYLEAQVSQKKFGFRDAGGESTAITDSPFISLQTGDAFHYNAPYFDATDPEDRNNRQLTASLSYFLSTANAGKHDIKAGFEHFTSTLTGGNSQSSTDFVFYTDYKTDASGAPLLDASGRFVPVFDPDNPATRLEHWLAVRGAEVDTRTLSFYVNDRWTLNSRWSFNLGARFESVRGEATGGIVTVNPGAVIVPRLAASFDPGGDGRWRVDATYAQYAGKYSESQFAANTNVGNPDYVGLDYVGPRGEGINFAPGLDPANYEIDSGEFPTANVFVDEDIRSPLAHEITFGVGRQIWGQGYVKALYTRRHTRNFVEDFFDDPTPSGRTTVRRDGVEYGTFDNVVYRNTDDHKREYQGVQLLTYVPLTARWNVNAHWTYQIRNHGTFEGEAANQPASPSLLGDHPEYRSPERHYPYGRLAGFQRHKMVAFTTFVQPLGRLGEITAGLTWRYESPLTYSHVAADFPVTAQQVARDPGYATPPTTQTLFFGERGEQEFAGYHVFHAALNYSVPVWRRVRPWVKLEVRNLLNNDKVIAWDRTIEPAAGGPADALGLPTTFTRGPRYGTVTSNNHHPLARELRVAVGFRF